MPTNFGIKVKVELAKRNMNMADLAKLLEISQPYLSDIVYGRRKATDQKERIKKILNIKEEE